MIESYGIALLAGVPNRVVSSGAYFRLLTGIDVDITFLRNGGVIGTARGMNAGFYVRARQGREFDEVMLQSASGQSVEMLIGEDEAGAADAVSVSGTVTVNHPGEVVISQHLGVMVGKSVATVGTLAAIFRGPELRRYLFMQNMNPVGGGDIFVMPDGVPTLNSGYKLSPGDSLTFDVWVPQTNLYAIATVAGSQLSFVIGT